MKNLFIIVVSMLFFSSCCRENLSVVSLSSKVIPLHIEMPENKIVFENLSSLVYDVLWQHFSSVGFRLCGKKEASYSLKVTIKNIDTGYKFLSPDLLTYATNMKIDLFCELHDLREDIVNKEKKVTKKTFTFRPLVHKAKDYVENSLFTYVEYRRLFEREVYKIDHYFREKMQ